MNLAKFLPHLGATSPVNWWQLRYNDNPSIMFRTGREGGILALSGLIPTIPWRPLDIYPEICWGIYADASHIAYQLAVPKTLDIFRDIVTAGNTTISWEQFSPSAVQETTWHASLRYSSPASLNTSSDILGPLLYVLAKTTTPIWVQWWLGPTPAWTVQEKTAQTVSTQGSGAIFSEFTKNSETITALLGDRELAQTIAISGKKTAEPPIAMRCRIIANKNSTTAVNVRQLMRTLWQQENYIVWTRSFSKTTPSTPPRPLLVSPIRCTASELRGILTTNHAVQESPVVRPLLRGRSNLSIPPQFIHGQRLGIGVIKDTDDTLGLPITPEYWDTLVNTTLVSAATGSGKSVNHGERRFLEAANAGFGAVLYDVADGAMIRRVLTRIPEERWNDVIVLDYGANTPPGIPLTEFQRGDQDSISEAWVQFFSAYFGADDHWQSKQFVRLAALAVFENREATFTQIIAMLTDQDYRASHVEQIHDSFLKAEWEKFATKDITSITRPIMNKLGSFSFSTRLKKILEQPPLRYDDGTPVIDYWNFAQNKKLVLVNAPESLPPSVQAPIITLHLMKAYAAAMQRESIPDTSARTPFFMICDEPQTYLKYSDEMLQSMFRKFRKYRFGMTILLQDLHMLKSVNQNLLPALLVNKPHIILGPTDESEISMLRKHIAPYDVTDIQRLQEYHFITAIRGLPPCITKGLGLPQECRTAEIAAEKIARDRQAFYVYPRQQQTLTRSVIAWSANNVTQHFPSRNDVKVQKSQRKTKP